MSSAGRYADIEYSVLDETTGGGSVVRPHRQYGDHGLSSETRVREKAPS